MPDILDTIQESAQKAVTAVTNKAAEIKDKTVIGAGIIEKQAEMEALYKDLGKAVYNSDLKTAITSDDAVAIIRDIQEREDELNALMKEQDELKNRTKCPGCGEYISNEMSFCGHCGTKRPE